MPDYLINSGLPDYPSSLDDEKANLVRPIYRAVNGLAQRIAESTGRVQYDALEQSQLNQLTKLSNQATQKIFVKALETLAYGMLVNLVIDSGKIAARKADASLARPAHGISDAPLGLTAGQFGEIIFMEGATPAISGSVFMTPYYLSNAGLVASSPAAYSQIVGYGLGAAGFYLRIAVK